jgi:hypothetical protein
MPGRKGWGFHCPDAKRERGGTWLCMPRCDIRYLRAELVERYKPLDRATADLIAEGRREKVEDAKGFSGGM